MPTGYVGAPFIGTLVAELLKQKDYKVTAITTSVALDNDYEVKTFSHKDFSWIVVPERPRSLRMNGKKPGRLLDFFAHEEAAMVKSLQAIVPDFVHAHWSYEFAGAALKAGYPCLVTVHDNAWQIFRFMKDAYRFGRLLMSERILRRVRFASTVSPYMLPYAVARCGTARVIPNPIFITVTDAEVEAMIAAKRQTLSAPRLLMINNGWNENKNGGAALAAFKRLQEKIPGATLHLFGSGSEAGGPAAVEAAALRVDHAFFHGAVSHDALIAELRQAHILVHPARSESFGVVLIEAMSCGVPALGGTKSGAVPWVIADQRMLADITKPAEIEERLLALFTDPSLYQEVALAGYTNVRNRFAAAAVVNDYIAYYKDIEAKW